MIDYGDFSKVEMHVGTVLEASVFEAARNPSYVLKIDFGDAIGIKKSSAQITDFYQSESLVGKQVIAVTNFPPKQIANVMSEVLVLGAVDNNHVVTLLQPERTVANGTRIS